MLPKWGQRRWRRCEKKTAAHLADYSSDLHFTSWMLYHDHAMDIKRVRFDTNTLNSRAPKTHTFVKRKKYGMEAKAQFSQNTVKLRRKGTHTHTQTNHPKNALCVSFPLHKDIMTSSWVWKMWWNTRPIFWALWRFLLVAAACEVPARKSLRVRMEIFWDEFFNFQESKAGGHR